MMIKNTLPNFFQICSTTTLVILVLLSQIGYIYGQGRLWEPPSRSSMWRRGYNTTVNNRDNELSCGGFTNQWLTYGGLCGVCGDPYQQQPRENEHSGKYASGFITRTYPIGGQVDVIVHLTANHKGYFEFKLCPLYDEFMKETTECMDRHPLKIKDGADDGYKYFISDPKQEGEVKLQLLLPRNFVCKHCVLQWKYNTGSRWGCDPDMTCGDGKGKQEQFYGCSDIAIDNVLSTVHHNALEVKDPTKRNPGFHDLGIKSVWDFVSDKHHETKTLGILPTRQTVQEPIIIKNRHILDNDQTAGNMTTGLPSSNDMMQDQQKKPKSVAPFLENVIIDALLESYEYGSNKANVPSKGCVAGHKYAKNPIINTWCMRVCTPTSPCSKTMCTCKARPSSVPVDARFKHPFLVNGNSQDLQKVQRKLALKRADVLNFVRQQLNKLTITQISPAESLKQGNTLTLGTTTTKASAESLSPIDNELNRIKISDSNNYFIHMPDTTKTAKDGMTNRHIPTHNIFAISDAHMPGTAKNATESIRPNDFGITNQPIPFQNIIAITHPHVYVTRIPGTAKTVTQSIRPTAFGITNKPIPTRNTIAISDPNNYITHMPATTKTADNGITNKHFPTQNMIAVSYPQNYMTRSPETANLKIATQAKRPTVFGITSKAISSQTLISDPYNYSTKEQTIPQASSQRTTGNTLRHSTNAPDAIYKAQRRNKFPLIPDLEIDHSEKIVNKGNDYSTQKPVNTRNKVGNLHTSAENSMVHLPSKPQNLITTATLTESPVDKTGSITFSGSARATIAAIPSLETPDTLPSYENINQVKPPEKHANQEELMQFIIRNLQRSSADNSDKIPSLPTENLDLSGFVKADYSAKEDGAVKHIVCTASTEFLNNKSMKDWCLKNCSFGFCPKSVCTCKQG